MSETPFPPPGSPTEQPPPGPEVVPSPTVPPPLDPAAPVAPPAVQRPNPNVRIAVAVLSVAALAIVGLVVWANRDDGGQATPGTIPATVPVTDPGTVPVTDPGIAPTTIEPLSPPGSVVVDGTLQPSALQEGEILLEPVNTPMADAFTATALPQPEQIPTISLPEIPLPTTTAPMTDTQVALPQVAGREPGLYGGTRDMTSCDSTAMIDFLESDPAKAAAWGEVQGIPSAEVREYVEGLTPVALTRDTRVTNHGFRDGRARPHQSVLQAGHAVLVDIYGVPRAKCSCGNPLAPPQPVTGAPTYVGPQWPGFSVTTIIVVIATEPVDEGFTIVDVVTGTTIVRPVGSRPGTTSVDIAAGDLRVTLRWTGTADLDLHVTDPSGAKVFHGSRQVASGGMLDVDANIGCGTPGAAAVENVVWQTGAPSGTYTVEVHRFSGCSDESTSFEVIVAVDGARTNAGGTGVVSSANTSSTFTFDFGGGSTAPTIPPDATWSPDSYEAEAAVDILGHLLIDCGIDDVFVAGGSEPGGYWLRVQTQHGVAEWFVYEPTGDWPSVGARDELAAQIAMGCGFYEP